MTEKKPITAKQKAHMERLHAAQREKRDHQEHGAVAEQTDEKRWQDQLAEFKSNPEARKPRPDVEQEELKASIRGERLETRPADPISQELEAERAGFARDMPRIDHSREVALRTEKIRQEEWRKAIEEDEKRRGPNPFKNPRLPMMPASQTFRHPDISEVPDDAVLPDGHAPKWVGMRDTLASGKDSMAQIRAHQAFGYAIVKDTQGRAVVTELGVLMSATYEDAAARQHYLTPRGSMKTGDSTERLHSVADDVNRRAGRRLVDVQQLPIHSRRVSNKL